MNHIILREGQTVTGVMCVEREIGSCIILQTSLDEIDKLLSIANAQGVPVVQVVMPKELVQILELKGWKATDYVVMYHE